MVKTVGVGVGVRIPYCFIFAFFILRSCKVCIPKQWEVESFLLFLGCFHKKREFSMNWKNTLQEGFPGPIKSGFIFGGVLLENFNVREVGQHQK